MKYRPPAGQGPFQRGERLTAAKLNDVVNAIRPVRAGGRAGLIGDTIVSDETETAYIRVTNRTNGRYSWVEVYRTENGTWANTTRTGNATYDWAVERNNQTVAAGSTVYEAKRSPDTSEWIFANTSGGGGNVDITGNETVLMVLGTYDDYKDCPGVPPKPPTLETVCGEDTGQLCVPAYAYAVYQRCGYIWEKLGDTRDFGVWANELNGGTASALRRFYIPRWGGDRDPLTGLPDPSSDCMGVAFLGYNSQSTLNCSCPECLTSPPEGACLWIKFRTASRPEVFNECGSTVTHFDNEDLWDKEIVFEITPLGCNAGGTDDTGTFEFEWQHITGSSLECEWGPDAFDPCDPCAGFGRLAASIGITVGGPNENCGGAGHWRGEFMAREICDLICDCSNGPIKPKDSTICDGCGNNIPPVYYFILPETVEIICCIDEIHDSAQDLPATVGDDNSGPTFQDQGP